MYEIDQTYLAAELAYRAERMRGERPDQHHEGHRTLGAVRRRRGGRILSRRAA
jgi:hypothetical protein